MVSSCEADFFKKLTKWKPKPATQRGVFPSCAWIPQLGIKKDTCPKLLKWSRHVEIVPAERVRGRAAKALTGSQRLFPPLSGTQFIQTRWSQVSGWCISGQNQQNQAARTAEDGTPANIRCSTSLQGHREGSRAMLWCWAAPTAAPHSPYLGSRTSLHTPLFCPDFSFPGFTPLQTNPQTTPAHRQGLCITHLQLTSDCPDISNKAPNCKAVAAAAPPRVSQGNALGVTVAGLTSPTTS